MPGSKDTSPSTACRTLVRCSRCCLFSSDMACTATAYQRRLAPACTLMRMRPAGVSGSRLLTATSYRQGFCGKG